TGVNTQGQLVHSERGFFGVHRVTGFTEEDTGTEYVQLYHGSTVHGRQRQSRDPARRREPLTYYHPRGPIGQVFTALSGTSAKPRVALIGLGTGSLASYGQPGQEMTFYEIDPAVVRIAPATAVTSLSQKSAPPKPTSFPAMPASSWSRRRTSTMA